MFIGHDWTSRGVRLRDSDVLTSNKRSTKSGRSKKTETIKGNGLYSKKWASLRSSGPNLNRRDTLVEIETQSYLTKKKKGQKCRVDKQFRREKRRTEHATRQCDTDERGDVTLQQSFRSPSVDNQV